MGKLVKCVINIVGLFLVLSLFAVFSGLEEDNLLNDFIGVANMISIAVCIAGVVTEQKLYIWIAYIGNVILGFMCIGVVNDKPHFIYKISGENFIGIMIAVAVIVLPVILLFADRKAKKVLKKNVNQARQEVYSDEELMMLQKFDRYKTTGYYLLKAKLQGIITYREMATGEQILPTYGVEINPDISGETWNEYDAIMKYLAQKKEDGKDVVQVADIIYDVKLPTENNSNKPVFTIVKEAEDFGIGSFLLCTLALVYVFITKWMMGTYSNNTPRFFVMAGFGAVALMFVIYGSFVERREKLIKKVLVDEIIKPEANSLEDIYQLFKHTNFENTRFSEEESARLLRAYSVYEYRQEDYANSCNERQFSDAVFAGVVSACQKAKSGEEG